MKNLVIIRGVPGVGKSTYAGENYPEHVLIEADQYFLRPDQTYDFNAKLLPNAHSWCLCQVKWWLAMGKNVVVANTFTRVWEMNKYIDLPVQKKVVRLTNAPFGNIHGVPDDKVQAMLERFENFPGEELIDLRN